ncbi:UBR3, partial [Cordylochernes scorpioides]
MLQDQVCFVKAFDTATTCGLVWTANFVAYRCRTCGISPCMSLCAECFQKGNHDGHDFNMFRSQAGGACDCGDTSVMRASGFCPKHGPRSKMSLPEVPPSLLNMARFIAPRLILRLIQHFRDSHQNPPPAPPDETQSAGAEANSSTTAAEYISMLQRLLEMGTAMHQVMTSALTSPEVYAELVVQPTAKAIHPDTPRSQRNSYHQRSHQLYMEAKKSLPPCQAPQKFQGLAPLDPNLEHKTFLDELMFWTVKLEFPQDLVCFLLTMLLDQTYKVGKLQPHTHGGFYYTHYRPCCSLYWGWVLFEQEEFMRTFVLHYGRISVMLSRSANAEPLSHRVVHVSVQLFSNEELAVRMVRDPELRLLHIMVVALKEMVTNILQPSTLHTEKLETNNLHLVADCSHRIMQTHCYWPLVSDLNNLLIHHQVAMDFLQPDYEDLIESWLAFVSMFQYMHLNQRELALHLEFEPKSYYAAFSAELEASATPMWSLISHLQGPEHLCVTRRLIKHCLTALEEWLESIDFAENDKFPPSEALCVVQPNRYQMSFHLPLHRNYAMFICQAVLNQGASLPNVLPPTRNHEAHHHAPFAHPDSSAMILSCAGSCILPERATFYEIMNALWVRNGVQIRGQSMTYIQCHFCNSMVDADIFLLQLSCGWVDSDWFLETFVDQGDQVGPMLEGCLTLLALVCSLHNYLGLREEEVTAREMVAGLCMADRTHSQLLDILPEKCGTSLANQPPNFETVLQQVASYKAPNFEAGGNMLQGTYVPKPHVWEQLYDPIHVSLRAVHRKDQQASMDRFTHYVKQSGKVDCQGNLWPPYRVPGPLPNSQFRDPRIVLHTRTMHAMIFILLYRALNEQDISENTVSLTVHLLDMAVRHTVPRPGQTNKPQEEVPDLRFQEWYPTDNILENAFIPINSIALPTTSSSPDQAMEVDQAELTRLEVKESIVSLLLKLHSKYSGKPDSFRISRDDRECLMGDGAHFIGRLLNHLAVMCGEQSVLAVQQHIWPWRSPEEDLEDRKKLTENRRRLAKECQKKVLAEMKMQQRVFMQAMETGLLVEMGDLEEASASAKEYECVICGHPSPSTTERPIGMVVLIQATSTLGHARQQTPLPLPCSEQELASVDQRRTRAVAVEQAILKLQWNFEDTWQLGLNVGWRGGVHIQSCGHHLHMDCHRSYLDSLRNRISASQQQNSAVDWGEYSCPFCRQLANSVLPLAMEQPPPPTLDEELPVWKIYRLLSAAPQPAKVSDAFGNITSFMENVTNSTSAQSRHYIPEPTHTSLFLFISSLARVNLEIDLLQTSPKKSCFERLFQVFVLNAKLLIGYEPFKDLWSQLNLLEDEFS